MITQEQFKRAKEIEASIEHTERLLRELNGADNDVEIRFPTRGYAIPDECREIFERLSINFLASFAGVVGESRDRLKAELATIIQQEEERR